MYSYLDDSTYFDDPTIEDEVSDQEQEVFHFRSIEHLPSEGVYE